MESNVYLKMKNDQLGPITTEEFQEMVKLKKVKPEDLIWDDRHEQWLPLTESDFIRNLLLPTESYERNIFGIGGGKGGVGKTSLTVSMGVALASHGHKVVIVDSDLGGSNLHNYLGINNPEYTFFDFYTMNKSSLNDIILPTSCENLFFISGACGTLGLANPKYSQKLRFIRSLSKIEANYILLDLGAGSSYNVIDFFLAAGDGIVISSPEPASIQETFHFLKKALMRKLSRTFKNQSELSSLFLSDESVWNDPKFYSIKKLYKDVEKIDKDSASIFRGIIQKFQPKLILNMVMNSSEVKEGISLKTAVGELLSIEMDFWGTIPYDDKVREAAMLQVPFLLHKPKCRASKQMGQLVSNKIMEYSRLRSYLDRKKLKQLISRLEVPDVSMVEETIICSVNCSYWDDCEYQNGGYPCGIRSLEASLKETPLDIKDKIEINHILRGLKRTNNS